jgi:hypothetical protein
LTVGSSFAVGQFGRQVTQPQQPPTVPQPQTKPSMPQRPQFPRLGYGIQAIQGSDYIAVESPDGRSISATSLKAHSMNKNEWASYAIPAGLSVTPLNSGSVLSLAYVGDEIKEVAVFFGYNTRPYSEGRWSKLTLREPARGRLSPTATGNTVLYQVGPDLYAFSSLCCEWGQLHLEGAEPPTIQFSGDSILVQQKETLYVFKGFTGQWTTGVPIKPVVVRPPIGMAAPPTPPPAPPKQ